MNSSGCGPQVALELEWLWISSGCGLLELWTSIGYGPQANQVPMQCIMPILFCTELAKEIMLAGGRRQVVPQPRKCTKNRKIISGVARPLLPQPPHIGTSSSSPSQGDHCHLGLQRHLNSYGPPPSEFAGGTASVSHAAETNAAFWYHTEQARNQADFAGSLLYFEDFRQLLLSRTRRNQARNQVDFAGSP